MPIFAVVDVLEPAAPMGFRGIEGGPPTTYTVSVAVARFGVPVI